MALVSIADSAAPHCEGRHTAVVSRIEMMAVASALIFRMRMDVSPDEIGADRS